MRRNKILLWGIVSLLSYSGIQKSQTLPFRRYPQDTFGHDMNNSDLSYTSIRSTCTDMVNMDNIFSQIMTQGKEYKIHFQVQDLALGLYERNADPDETQKAAFFSQQWDSSNQSNSGHNVSQKGVMICY